jgi:hypothetical protein
MLDQRVRMFSEALARMVNRRIFLQRTGSAVASGVSAIALGSLLTKSTARAAANGPLVPGVPSCAPPGPYCNTGGGDLSGCHGGHCYRHLYNGQVLACQIWYCCYAVGCWTTSAQGGFWTCCDCQCGTPMVTSCGCAQFNATPVTLAE